MWRGRKQQQDAISAWELYIWCKTAILLVQPRCQQRMLTYLTNVSDASQLMCTPQMFEGAFSPPVYNDLYNFPDGAQDDIFDDSYTFIPDPAPNAALPVLADRSKNETFTSTSASISPSGKLDSKPSPWSVRSTNAWWSTY